MTLSVLYRFSFITPPRRGGYLVPEKLSFTVDHVFRAGDLVGLVVGPVVVELAGVHEVVVPVVVALVQLPAAGLGQGPDLLPRAVGDAGGGEGPLLVLGDGI